MNGCRLRLRSVLFFPADRPERYQKALATGSDAVCIDLEDAVGPDRKDEARAAALELLRQPPPERTSRLLRINHPDTAVGAADVRALVEATSHGAHIDALLVPEADLQAADALTRQVGARGRSFREQGPCLSQPQS